MATKKSSSTKDDRTRNWTFVVYPTEGNPPAPENWRDIIDEEHIQWIESPMHDKDKNADGTPKKPHIHVLVLYEGKKSFEQVKELTDRLNAPIPQKCANAKGLVRYFAHMDNPEKVQYSKSGIIAHGGADIAPYLKATSTSRYEQIAEMRQWVVDTGCVEFCDLFDYAATQRPEDWLPLLCDNSAYIMGEYIKSRRNRGVQSNGGVVVIDKSTGEILQRGTGHETGKR